MALENLTAVPTSLLTLPAIDATASSILRVLPAYTGI
jgi:hypothetical protein